MPTDNGPTRDVKPEKYSTPDKKKGESFNEAMNPPNNPTKDKQPSHYNVNYDYPTFDHDPGDAEDYT
jgi:hypothetical protein